MTQQKPWLSNYPKNVPANIDPEKYCSLLEMLENACAKYAKKSAFACFGKEISYEQLNKSAAHLAAYFHSRGLEPGDKIALMMPNLLQYPISMLAALKAGLIIVNTNPLYTPREMEHQFNDSNVKAIIIAENFAANLEKIIEKSPIKIVITTSIGEMLGFVKGGIVNFVTKKIKGMVPAYNISNTVKFSDAINQGKKFSIKKWTATPDDIIVHQYTGGTTGVSKGAMLSNRNLMANVLQMTACWVNHLEEEKEVIITALPLYHIFAFAVNCLSFMVLGGLNVLVTNARDLPSVIKEFKRYPVTIMTGVNTLFNALLNHPDFKTIDFSNFKFAAAGGMALQKAVAIKWQEMTGTPCLEGYGLTEASPVVSFNPIGEEAKIGTIGIPIPSTDVRIVGDNGEVLAMGEVGELQIQGPQVMVGYYNRPEETAKTIVDGWLCTGDMATMDEQGYFKIVDRKKDMILVSGFNVYPNEIEDVVALHPKVLEVAAIGIPHEKSGEVVKVFVVKKDNSLTKDELVEYCRENMTGYKVPKEIEFRKELPKSNVGKILRRQLREEKES